MIKRPSIIFISGAHVDLKGTLDASAIPGVSNPGTWQAIAGGAGLNAARVAQMTGADCAICGLLGDDAHGELVREEMSNFKITNLHEVHEHLPTGTYTSIIEPNGNLVLALADLKLNDEVSAQRLWDLHEDKFCAADCLFLSANMSAEALQTFVRLSKQYSCPARLAACTISPAKASRLKPILPHLDMIFTNLAEARILLDNADAEPKTLATQFATSGCLQGTISNGAEQLTHWQNETITQLSPQPIQQIVDVTGAGDALAGTALTHYLMGKPFAEAVQMGMTTSRLTLMSDKPVPKT